MTESKNDDHGSEITAIDMSTPSSSTQTGTGVPGKPETEPKGDIVQNEKVGRPGDRDDGNHILQQSEVMDQLPYTWTPKKKWTVLSVIFVVQCSMNCKSMPCLAIKADDSQCIDLRKWSRLPDGKVRYISTGSSNGSDDLSDLLRLRM